jgi:hypothetical protein
VKAILWSALIAVGGLIGCRSHPEPVASRAVSRLRELRGAVVEYKKACGRFPPTLQALAAPQGEADPSCAELRARRAGADDAGIAQLLNGATVVDAYQWSYVGRPAGFQLHATYRGDGERHSFFTDHTGTIRLALGRPAGPTDEPLR